MLHRLHHVHRLPRLQSLRRLSARSLRPWLPLSVALLPVVVLGACGSDSLKPKPPIEPTELYWALELNHRAATLSLTAPHNTLQLEATPRNHRGEPLADLPAPRYVSRDPERVGVTDEGLVTAAAASEPVWVVATLTTENLKHEDSAWIKVVAVTDPPPVLASFSVHPLPGDSAKTPVAIVGLNFNAHLPVQAADPNDVALDNLIPGGVPVAFRSSDPTVAIIGPSKASGRGSGVELLPGEIRGLRPGAVTFYASTTVFGVTKADTVPYRIGWPVVAEVEVGGPATGLPAGTFLQPEVTLGTGGAVIWFIADGSPDLTISTDVTFADSLLATVVQLTSENAAHPFLPFFCFGAAECGSGNVTVGGAGLPRAIRVFPAPGTYEYQSTLHGTRGRIVVVAE